MFELVKLRSAVMVPEVVTGVEPIVRVELEEDNPTEVTVPFPKQLPEMEKQPFFKLIPPMEEKEVVAGSKLTTLLTDRREPGEVEATPR